MKASIQAFIDQKKLGIAGASTNKDNFGRTLMVELKKKNYEIIPVNPLYPEVEGVATVPTVRELPPDVENLILATAPAVTEQLVSDCIGSSVKRVWMVRGVGKGSATERAIELCRENNIEVVHGFCPMMFFGEGMHRFHLWIRKTFGKVPAEYVN